MNSVSVVHYAKNYLSSVGFKYILKKYPEFNQFCSFNNKADFIDSLKTSKPSIVVIDFSEETELNLDSISFLKSINSKTEFVILLSNLDKKLIKSLVKSGINCIITTSCEEDEIISALYSSIKRNKFFCNKILDVLLEENILFHDCSPTSLTDKEIQILSLIAKGLSNKEISEKLFISIHTVYTHRKNIIKKLNLTSTAELTKYAYSLGFNS